MLSEGLKKRRGMEFALIDELCPPGKIYISTGYGKTEIMVFDSDKGDYRVCIHVEYGPYIGAFLRWKDCKVPIDAPGWYFWHVEGTLNQ
jgi:hypothetical protein